MARRYRRIPRYIGDRIFDFLTWLGKGDWTSVTEIEDPYRSQFIDAFNRRFNGYLLVVLAIVTVFVADYWASGSANIQLYGLIFDVVGAVVLARGVIRGEGGLSTDSEAYPTMLILNSDSDKGPTNSQRYITHVLAGGKASPVIDPESLHGNAHESVDAFCGGVFLLVGFTIQIFAVIGPLRWPF